MCKKRKNVFTCENISLKAYILTLKTKQTNKQTTSNTYPFNNFQLLSAWLYFHLQH